MFSESARAFERAGRVAAVVDAEVEVVGADAGFAFLVECGGAELEFEAAVVVRVAEVEREGEVGLAVIGLLGGAFGPAEAVLFAFDGTGVGAVDDGIDGAEAFVDGDQVLVEGIVLAEPGAVLGWGAGGGPRDANRFPSVN